jgi:hypothetical protein
MVCDLCIGLMFVIAVPCVFGVCDFAGVMLCRRLFELFLDPSNHPLCRQSAIVYLASLLARSNFIPVATAR